MFKELMKRGFSDPICLDNQEPLLFQNSKYSEVSKGLTISFTRCDDEWLSDWKNCKSSDEIDEFL